jgi:hypothetical protein
VRAQSSRDRGGELGDHKMTVVNLVVQQLDVLTYRFTSISVIRNRSISPPTSVVTSKYFVCLCPCPARVVRAAMVTAVVWGAQWQSGSCERIANL